LRYIFRLLVLLLLFSCYKSKKEYYDTGELKTEELSGNGKIDRIVKGYYKNGGLKELLQFSTHSDPNLTISYYEKPENIKKKAIYRLDNTSDSIIEYYPNGNIKARGEFFMGQRVGKWNLHNESGHLDATFEYKRVNGTEYLNQTWYLNQNGDTLYRGNFSHMDVLKDTVNLGEYLDFYFHLQVPLVSTECDVYVIIPKNEENNFNKDFSNEKEIETIEVPSLANDSLNYDSMDPNTPFNLIVTFQKLLHKKGKYNFRGILVESHNLIDGNNKYKDSINVNKRKIYIYY